MTRKSKAPANIDAVSVLDADTGGLAEPYKRTVAAALPPGVKPTEEFWHGLETAVTGYLGMQQGRATRPAKHELRRWKNIDALASKLGEELRAMRRQTSRGTFEPLLWLPAVWEIKRQAEAGVRGYDSASSSGSKNPARAYLYGAVCDLWRCPRDAVRIHFDAADGFSESWDPPTGLGQPLAYSRTAEGEPRGPLIRFFTACVGPVLGDAAPNVYGIATIIEREKAAREAAREELSYFFGRQK